MEGKTEILSIDGVTHSRSDLNHDSFYRFSLQLHENGRIKFNTLNDFFSNIQWVENRSPQWVVSVQTWNNKIYIINGDGSHHLAAIYRQCREQGKTYELPTIVYNETINFDKLRDLLDNYYLIFSHEDNLYKLYMKYRSLFPNKYDKLIAYNLNAENRYLESSHILSLKKDVVFNIYVVDLLARHKEQFLILNNQLEPLHQVAGLNRIIS